MKLVALFALLGLFACGSAADDPSSSPMEQVDETPAAQPAPDVHFAPVVQSGSPTIAPVPAPVEQPAPVVAVSSPVAPAPVVAPAPAPVVEPVATEPDPTPAHPFVIDCRADDCAACNADLRATHADWYESGAAVCLLRSCAVDGECGSLGADLKCLPTDVGAALVCRLPRLHEFQACDENAAENACEVGLLCQAGRCRKGH